MVEGRKEGGVGCARTYYGTGRKKIVGCMCGSAESVAGGETSCKGSNVKVQDCCTCKGKRKEKGRRLEEGNGRMGLEGEEEEGR